MELFREKGVEGTTVEEIAGRAGVSKGTYFFHYSTKERVFGNYVEVLAQDLLPSLPAWLSLPPLDGILAPLAAISAAAETDRRFIPNVAFALLFGHDPCRTPIPLETMFFPLVERAQRAGALRADLEAPLLVSHLLSNYLINLIWAARLPDIPLTEFLDPRMRLTIDGLHPQP
jgi:AcrR family transcriptional regulator